MKFLAIPALVAAIIFSASEARAGVILGATNATASSTNPECCGIEATIDQSGLSIGYISGGTDFDTYIASNPLHGWDFNDGAEWYSEPGAEAVIVDYDLGGPFSIDALAFWNEDIAGIGEINLSGSLNGVDYFLLSVFTPAPNALFTDYAAELFSFSSSFLRYVRLEFGNCVVRVSGACGIGEVAFRAADGVSEVPIPGAVPLFLAGLTGLGWIKRRRSI